MEIIIRAGIGIDIGTTTVQAQLIDLDTKNPLDFVSVLNEQRKYGTDVMTRIAKAREGKMREMTAIIRNQIKEILLQFINKWNLQKIEKCSVSGNTTMLHFFTGDDPGGMREAPFTPVFLEERQFKGSELSLPADEIFLPPGISAFVGADVVSGLAFLDIINKTECALFADIGTNGEIVLWNKKDRFSNLKRLLCCSTAAGSCFEIPSDHNVQNKIENKITYGSDLIDVIAKMRRENIIDEAGTFNNNNDAYATEQGFIVTQKDVRDFQLAKSAIYSGIHVLCKTAGIEPANLEAAYIAGGMGFHFNLENAASVGLLPQGIISKAQICRNTSLNGTVKSLTDNNFLKRCKEIIAYSSAFDLAVDREFAESFVNNMGF